MPQGGKFQPEIIRFASAGIALNLPPELVPLGKFVRLTNAVEARDGTLQSVVGGTQILSNSQALNMRRLTDWTTGVNNPQSILVYANNNGTDVQILWANATSYPPSFQGAIGHYQSADQGIIPSFVADTSGTFAASKGWMFVGFGGTFTNGSFTMKMVKVDVNGNTQKFGISTPTSATSFGVDPAVTTGGNLQGPYDWRHTYFNNLTSQESNPFISTFPNELPDQVQFNNQGAAVTVTASPDPQVTGIYIYRRGGTLGDNWRRIPGINSDGTFQNINQTVPDNNQDADIASAQTLDLDNDVPVTSVSSGSTTITEVPVPFIWGGEMLSTLFACGDPNRPDVVYWSKKGFPESWPFANFASIAHPEEKLMNGFLYNGASYVWSKFNLYQLVPDLVGGNTWTPVKTTVGKGIVGNFSFCIGPKVWFCDRDGVWETDGASLPIRISDDIRSLFPYGTLAGYQQSTYIPINFGGVNSEATTINIRMTYHNGEVRLYYQGVDLLFHTAVYNVEQKSWRFETDGVKWGYSDEITPAVLIQQVGNDTVANYGLVSDRQLNGSNISVTIETGGHDQSYPRIDKLYGDAAVWLDPGGGTVTWSAYTNSNFTSAAANGTITGLGLARYVLPLGSDLYGRHISFRFTWTATQTVQPVLYWIELSYIPQVEDISGRQTDWDDLGQPTDKLVKGVVIEADTEGNTIFLQAQYDGGTVGANFSLGRNTSGTPAIYNIGFQSFRAREVRLVPTGTTPWKLYRVVKWLFDPEPEAIGWHEVYWGDAGYPSNKLIKGVILEADTEGLTVPIDILDDSGTIQQSLTIGPGTSGIPSFYELSWTSFRTHNVRLLQHSATGSWKLFRIANWIFEPEPHSLLHYESAEGNSGFFAYHFERESYIELNSSAIVTVTPTIDRNVQIAYTIPSTAGVRKRVYLPFSPNKGKLYKYSLDSSSPFLLYDHEIRGRGWNTRIFFDLYYRVFRPDYGTTLTGGQQ